MNRWWLCFYAVPVAALVGLLASGRAADAAAAELKILLPLDRAAFQTNEWIDFAVVRSSKEALPAATLGLTLTGKDGSKITAAFPLPAAAVQGKTAAQTEHLHINGWLLRPGHYTLEAVADGVPVATAQEIDVYNHVRQSSFRLVNWGRAKPKEQGPLGEDGMGFNLFYGGYGQDEQGSFIRAGVDFMSCCTMGGAHQMDIRQECDWSDPYVTRGGTARVVRRAMMDRTRPHVPGVHFYDEPGLTWNKYDETGEVTPHMIKSQVRSYLAAFDREPLAYNKVDPNKPDDVAHWNEWAKWKLSFMDAAWKEAQFGVSQVRPDYLSVNQSQYGWSAFTDGYYFNVTRSLPVTSGHGGYDDYGPCVFNPSFTLEMARARDYGKPNWYLPCWYGNTPSDRFRLEQYLSFQTNIQGMISPPDLEPAVNPAARQGIVESNQLMKRLGPVFTTMPVTKPPVAVLYSLSQVVHAQTKDMKANYAHAIEHGKNLPIAYLAGKVLHQPFLAVLDEDVVDGTLANDHKAVVLTSVDHLAPEVVEGLESFAANGGLVLLTGDSTVPIKGAVKLSARPALPDQEQIDKLAKAGKWPESMPYQTLAKWYEGATTLANAIRPELEKAGIKPLLGCDLPTVSVTRQAAGDVEYFFLVNATPDEDAKDAKGNKERQAVKAVSATVTLPDDGRPVYDAVVGGPVNELLAKDGKVAGTLRFGPGEMHVLARTARPIGGARVKTPTVTRDLLQEKDPIKLEIGATVLDNRGGPLSGSVPLHIQVIDPFGVVRHELYQATRLGSFGAALPLAANDPAGTWKVVVRDLLANTEDAATFTYTPPARVKAIVGATPRAVYAANDRENAFRFARLFHEVTIVKGKSSFNDAAAKRLATVLEPWGVKCKEMDLAAASKSRPITEAEAATWCGMEPGRTKPGDANPPQVVGFAVQGPVLLLGNPDDNPIIKHLQTARFLPYAPAPGSFPGNGRGMFAWQRDGVGKGQESIALIAYDEAGMSEAVGTLYEAVAGLDPLTRWALPTKDSITSAKAAPNHAPAAQVAWAVRLPDRIDALKAGDDGLTVLSHDGSLAKIGGDGKVASNKPVSAAEAAQLAKDLAPAPDAAAAEAAKGQSRPDRMVKLSASHQGKVAVGYWGGTLRVVDEKGAVLTEQQLPQDVTALAWLNGKLIAGLADGRVLALTVQK